MLGKDTSSRFEVHYGHGLSILRMQDKGFDARGLSLQPLGTHVPKDGNGIGSSVGANRTIGTLEAAFSTTRAPILDREEGQEGLNLTPERTLGILK
jgi:hypothetical protein